MEWGKDAPEGAESQPAEANDSPQPPDPSDVQQQMATDFDNAETGAESQPESDTEPEGDTQATPTDTTSIDDNTDFSETAVEDIMEAYGVDRQSAQALKRRGMRDADYRQKTEQLSSLTRMLGQSVGMDLSNRDLLNEQTMSEVAQRFAQLRQQPSQNQQQGTQQQPQQQQSPTQQAQDDEPQVSPDDLTMSQQEEQDVFAQFQQQHGENATQAQWENYKAQYLAQKANEAIAQRVQPIQEQVDAIQNTFQEQRAAELRQEIEATWKKTQQEFGKATEPGVEEKVYQYMGEHDELDPRRAFIALYFDELVEEGELAGKGQQNQQSNPLPSTSRKSTQEPPPPTNAEELLEAMASDPATLEAFGE